MGNSPVFASAAEAVELARAALGYLASADATGLTAEEQAGCLQGLERVTSVTIAARSSVLGAFTAGKGYSAAADYSPRASRIRKTGVTRGAAVAGVRLRDRAVLASEMPGRSWQPDTRDLSPETGPDGQGSRLGEDPG